MNSATIALILNVIAVVGAVLWKIFLGGRRVGSTQEEIASIKNDILNLKNSVSASDQKREADFRELTKDIGWIKQNLSAILRKPINGD